jgi:hypothetical protein
MYVVPKNNFGKQMRKGTAQTVSKQRPIYSLGPILAVRPDNWITFTLFKVSMGQLD